jgi:electron transport complex protein RnfG
MKEMLRYGLILGLICTVASGLLAGVNSLTKARIIAQAKAEEEASLKEVLPEAERFAEVKSEEEILYYKAYDKEAKFIGVAFKVSAKGYSSTIETMVGMTKDGKITAIKILSQNETPGLGARISEPGFTGQFSHKNISALDQVEAITGATFSSQAVIDTVKKKAQEINDLIKNEK